MGLIAVFLEFTLCCGPIENSFWVVVCSATLRKGKKRESKSNESLGGNCNNFRPLRFNSITLLSLSGIFEAWSGLDPTKPRKAFITRNHCKPHFQRSLWQAQQRAILHCHHDYKASPTVFPTWGIMELITSTAHLPGIPMRPCRFYNSAV